MKKQWWKSKTLITATAAFIGVVATEVSASPETAATIQAWVALLLPVAMAALRGITHSSLTTKEEK